MPTLTVKMNDEQIAEITAYADSRGVSRSDAIRHLISAGLASEIGNLHYGSIADAVRDVLRSELSMFQDALDDLESDLNDHLDTIRYAQNATLLMLAEEEDAPPINTLTKEDLQTSAQDIADYIIAGADIAEGIDSAWASRLLKEI